MTPFERLGYTREDKFRVVTDNVDNSSFTVRDIIYLLDDDDTTMPMFYTKEGRRKEFYVHLNNIVKIL